MKKVVLMLFVIAAIVVSCDDTNENIPNQQETQSVQDIDMSDFYLETSNDEFSRVASASNEKKCHSMNVLNEKLKKNPMLYSKMYDIEYHTRKAIANKPGNGNGNGNGGGGNGGGGDGGGDPVYTGSITIPVIVNIIETSSGDVTQAQINSQIAILNEDFNNNNPNTSNAPAEFAGLVADVDITFTLAGVNRRTNSQSNWGTNDSMKFASQGGIDVTDPANNLNIWVVNQMQTSNGEILGYAQFPGGSSSTDGVVLGKSFFGETGGVYGDGRTGTHEVGHWLNLRHIWGDGRCNRDDFVDDTPRSDRSNGGCPSYPTVHCRSADMTMNYMDYVYDDCMYMFTNGQNDRMRALFTAGGARESFVQ